jgi:large subunit ribosomal protein L1
LAEENILKVVKEALERSPKRNFQQSVEIAINLKDVDLTNPKNRLSEDVILPKGRGKTLKVGIFATQEMQAKARAVADLVIPSEEIPKLAEDKVKAKKQVEAIDFFIAEAPLMAGVGKSLGVILGPRGKMPKPIPPGSDPANVVANLKKTVKVRSKDRRTFQVPVGTSDMSAEDLAENIEAVLNRIRTKLERGYQNIHTAYVKTTMGPAVKLDLR